MDDLQARLAEPFAADDVGWKPQSVKGNRAMAIAYIDARNVMDRLDAVVGVGGWSDAYEVLTDGSVVCRLRVRVNGEWVEKTDVGGMSEQPDAGDRLKAAFSDALKRAAVKFGIGRYLYSLPSVWCDYDPQKRAFSQTPTLPAWALPKAKPVIKPQPQPATNGKGLPATGEELERRLRGYDAKLAGEKRCGLGALLAYVSFAGAKAGYGEDITRWTGPAIQFAVDAAKNFEAGLTNQPAAKQQQNLPGTEADDRRGLPD